MKDFGCYTNLSNEDYHADKNFISRSALMDFNKSPYTYWANHLNPDKPIKETTSSMKFGSAFHTLLLEPHKFDYVVKPTPVLLKDAGREAYDNYKKTIKTIEKTQKMLTQEEYETLLAMQTIIDRNQRASELIQAGLYELSYFWKEKESGLLLKARPDILHENIIVDLKTTSDASYRTFQNEMIKYGYHIQMAMIRDAVEATEGRRINNCINIVIETKYPHHLAIYIMDEEAIDAGERKYKQLCLDLKECLEKDEWPDYGIQTIYLPRWAE